MASVVLSWDVTVLHVKLLMRMKVRELKCLDISRRPYLSLNSSWKAGHGDHSHVIYLTTVSEMLHLTSLFPYTAKQQLQSCMAALFQEQRALVSTAAGSTLSTCRLRQQLMVAQRFFVALNRHQGTVNSALNTHQHCCSPSKEPKNM